MSDQMTDRDVEQAFTHWVDEVAPTAPPDRLLESTFVRTMGAGQVRVYPWHKLLPRRRELSYSGAGVGFGIALLVLLIVLAMAAGFVGGAFQPMASPSPSPTPAVTTNPTSLPSPALPDAITVIPEASVDVSAPIAMVTDGDLLWVLAPGRIDRIDPSTGAVTGSATLGSEEDLYNGMAVNDADLWATNSDAAVLYRVDAATLEVAAEIDAGRAPKGVLANVDGVWVADVHGGSVLRIDPATNEVAATVKVGSATPGGPNWLAEGLGSIWVDVPNNRTIVRIDPVTDAIQATIEPPDRFQPCGGIAVTDDSAWVTSCSGGNLIARIDAPSNTSVATIDMQGHGYTPTVINGSVWVSVDGGTPESGKLVRIDPATNTIDRVLVPESGFGGGGDIVVAAGSVWVVDGYHNMLIQLPMSAFAP